MSNINYKKLCKIADNKRQTPTTIKDSNKKLRRIEDMSQEERLKEAQKMCDGTDIKTINGLPYKTIQGDGFEYAKLIGAISIDDIQWTK